MAKMNGKLALSALFLFVAGALFGASLLHVGMRYRMFFHGFGPRSPEQAMVDHLSRRLDLTPEQVRKLEPIVNRFHERLEALKKETAPRVDSLIDEAVQEAEPALAPNQVEQLHRMQARFKERIRRPPGAPPPPPEGGPPDGDLRGPPPPPDD